MRIKCELHGFCEGVQVSAALKEQMLTSGKIDAYVSVYYEYKEDNVALLILSSQDAKEQELEDGAVLPLPDDYPEWVTSLVPVCERCFEESAGVANTDDAR